MNFSLPLVFPVLDWSLHTYAVRSPPARLSRIKGSFLCLYSSSVSLARPIFFIFLFFFKDATFTAIPGWKLQLRTRLASPRLPSFIRVRMMELIRSPSILLA